jgi:hypothetical protein
MKASLPDKTNYWSISQSGIHFSLRHWALDNHMGNDVKGADTEEVDTGTQR